MYVIYYGIGNSFVGSLAANLHLNPTLYNEFTSKLLFEVPYLLEQEQQALGRLLFIGEDKDKNKIFLLNTRHAETIVIPALQSVFDILQISKKRLLLVDTTEMISPIFLVGKLLCLCRIRKLGEYLMSIGINKLYNKIEALVYATREKTKT